MYCFNVLVLYVHCTSIALSDDDNPIFRCVQPASTVDRHDGLAIVFTIEGNDQAIVMSVGDYDDGSVGW
jgi:hypothetical protein